MKELHKTFATLSQKDQRTATVILHDIQSGDLHLSPGKSIYDYITEYQFRELHQQIMILVEATGINASQLENIMARDITEQNLNEYSQFDNLKLTLNMTKTREFIAKVKGSPIPARLVMPEADKLLRAFILNAGDREQILNAYLGHEDVVQTESPKEEDSNTEEQHVSLDVIKKKVLEILETQPAIFTNMRPLNEIIKSVFYVVDKPSIASLDTVGIFIHRAFTNLYGNHTTIVDKFVAFNLLVTKFEAYLKKLYYLMKNQEVQPQFAGEQVSWKNVIYAHKSLWNLKFSDDTNKQQLYQYLMLVKDWRNDESHISPTVSEQELDAAIQVIITMYCYTTGSSITELEMNGHDVEAQIDKINATEESVITPTKTIQYSFNEQQDHMMAAEQISVKDLPEEKRIEILKKSINQLLGYEPQKSPLSKQRHWVAIYRVAADLGFIIDGDFPYFKKIIDNMQIENLPVPLKIDSIEKSLKGIYAENFEDWIADGLEGRKLSEFNDVKYSVDEFVRIIKGNIPKKE